MMISPTSTRVEEQTQAEVNRKIHRETEGRFARSAIAGPEAIHSRLNELNQEWDVERTLQTNFAAVTLTGLVFSVLRGKSWRMLSAVAAGFMIQHALQGWCPPVAIFRRLSLRTKREIDHERFALKALRGDFENLSRNEPTQSLSAAERLV